MSVIELGNRKLDEAKRGMKYGLPGFGRSNIEWWTGYIEGAEDQKREDEQPASPWHRVELEEPTKEGWYLVMDEDGDFNVDEWHNTFGWQFVTPSDADRITYWMPIEPPMD